VSGALRGPAPPFGPGALALLALALLALAPALGAGFVWDDDLHLLRNPVLLDDGLWRVWVRGEAIVYWPVTWTSYWMEHRLWGLQPAGYHAVNVVLHGLNGVLLWRLLLRLGIPGAWLAACAFALHPVNVESAAWIAQRKNLLCFLFGAGSLLAFLRFEAGGRRAWYALAIAAYLLSMLSKGATAGLPALLLLLAWWQRDRLTRADALRALPFLAVAVAVSLSELYFHRHETVRDASLAERLVTAGWALWFYLYKALLPIHLSFVYERWEADPQRLLAWAPGLLATALLAAAWSWRDRGGRPWLFAASSFVLLLAPILGLFDFYYLRYSLVGDHYQYFAIAAPIAGVVAGVERLTRGGPRAARIAAAAALLLVLGSLTWQRARVFRDVELLWRDALRGAPGATLAHHNLGLLLLERGQPEEGWDHLREALALDPDSAEIHQSIGSLLLGQGDLEGATRHVRRALEIDPGFARAHGTLGLLLETQGRPAEALARYERAAALDPAAGPVQLNRARLLVSLGRLTEAVEAYRAAATALPALAAPRLELERVLEALAAAHASEAAGRATPPRAATPPGAAAPPVPPPPPAPPGAGSAPER
jgi:tetratricopeptide (TPR) repeat protein